MKTQNYIISRIPIFLFLATTIVYILSANMSYEGYEQLYYYLNEIMNSSLLVNIFMLLAVYRYKLCLYNKVSAFALLSLNILNIFFLMTSFDYDVYEFYTYIYVHAIMIPVSMLAIILYIKGI